jgi:hypothetical protein
MVSHIICDLQHIPIDFITSWQWVEVNICWETRWVAGYDVVGFYQKTLKDIREMKIDYGN